MNAKSISFFRTAGILAGALLLTQVRAAEADAFPVPDNNYIKLSAQAPSISGSDAAFQARTKTAEKGAAGIEALSYGYDLSKETNLQIDGHALPGQENYLAQFRLTKNEVGSFEAGYKRFRSFYDGAGGFFPLNNAWMPLANRDIYVDRGKFFANATIALPKAPVFTFKYANETRSGRKDSTIWGDSNLTGLTTGASKKIVPNYIDLNERTETWEASMKHTVANTTALVTIAGDRIKNFDSRQVLRNPGELKAFGTIAATPSTLVPASLATNQTRGLDQQGLDESGYTFAGKIETVVNEKVSFFAGWNYHHAESDISGSRLIVATIATGTGIQNLAGGYSNGGRPPYSYTSAGNTKLDVLTGNIGVDTKPMPNLSLQLALKGEQYKASGLNNISYVNQNVVLATGAITQYPVSGPSTFKNNEKPWTPAVDARYTGIKNLALYASWDYRYTSQDERFSTVGLNVVTSGATAGFVGPSLSQSFDKIAERHVNFKVGANWTPSTLVNGRAEVFTKDHENRFDGYASSLGSFYYLDYDITGVKLTGLLRPLPVLSLTTRYIVQRGKASITEDTQSSTTAGDSRRYQLGETVSWNPSKLFYVQADANLVYETIVTSYPRVTGTARDVLHNSDNNYWNGDITAGFVVDKNTDAMVQATYYKSNNYNPALAYTTMPFGMSARDYTVSVGMKHRFAEKTFGTAKVGYIDSENLTSGGNMNFHGPMAYLAVEHAF